MSCYYFFLISDNVKPMHFKERCVIQFMQIQFYVHRWQYVYIYILIRYHCERRAARFILSEYDNWWAQQLNIDCVSIDCRSQPKKQKQIEKKMIRMHILVDTDRQYAKQWSKQKKQIRCKISICFGRKHMKLHNLNYQEYFASFYDAHRLMNSIFSRVLLYFINCII